MRFLYLNMATFGLTASQNKKFADALDIERTLDLAMVSERDLENAAIRVVLPHGIRHVIAKLHEAKTRRIGPYTRNDDRLQRLLAQLVSGSFVD